MKKIYFFLIALFSASVVSAETLALTPDNWTQMTTAGAYSATYGDITIDISQGIVNAQHIRCYKSQTFKVTVKSGTIQKITLTCTANGNVQYGPGGFTGDGYKAGSDKTGVWEGDAQSVTLTATSNQVRMTKIEIEYTAKTVNPEDPFIDAEDYDFGTLVLEGQTITANHTISVTSGNLGFISEAGAPLSGGIKVSVLDVDGGPSANFTADKDSLFYEQDRVTITFTASTAGEYTAILNLTSGNTFKNVNLKATVLAPITIAEALKMMPESGNNSSSFILNDVVVTYKNGTYGVFVKDATGYVYIYDKTLASSNVYSGCTLKGLQGVITSYNSLPEITSVSVQPTIEGGTAEYQPELVTDPLTNSDISRYVLVKNVAFAEEIALSDDKTNGRGNVDVTINGGTILLYNNFLITATIEANTAYDIVGIVGIYKEKLQFQPISFTKAGGTPSALENTVAGGEKAVKVIENGQLVIVVDGVRYNALGAVIK